MSKIKNVHSKFLIYTQIIPPLITIITSIVLSIFLFFFLHVLNLFPSSEKVQLKLLPIDILVGVTIYIKTSIDFAIFIGRLMKSNPGWKKRIAIELGTALGNACGTTIVLTIWFFFKQAPFLMIIMILIASLILLKMAQEGFEEYFQKQKRMHMTLFFTSFYYVLCKVNTFFNPLFSILIPRGVIPMMKLSFTNLFILSFRIPFILGLDDFAGYIPLFSIINVFSFCIGVIIAHMALNFSLFISPQKTTTLVNHSFVLIAGGFAFIGLALWGVYEAFVLCIHLLY